MHRAQEKRNRQLAGFFYAYAKPAGVKKPARKPALSEHTNYLFAADAAADAAEAAVEAAEVATEAAAAASTAAEAAIEALAAAVSAGAAGAGAGATSTTGAGATTGASSFLLQAAKATASREMISRDFFMGFP
jgi:hypothetical protein